MKKLHQDLKRGEMKLKAESLNDLWYLSQIIEPGDLVSGKTLRKIKIGESTDRNQKVVRKPVFLSIEAEKVEFSNDILRVTGKVREGPDDVSHGSYHTFNIEENTIFNVTKERWFSYHLDRIKDSLEESKNSILLVVMDREEVHFALLERAGYRYLSSLQGEVQKKDVEQRVLNNFYRQIIKALEEYDERYHLTHIILGSPSFWKEDLLKVAPDDIRKKTITATCGSVGERSFDELLKRDEVQNALRAERISKEIAVVERILKEISKGGNAAYGFTEVAKASEMGAVEELSVTDTFIWKMREMEQYERLESVLKSVEKSKGKVFIVSKEHEAGQKLDGIGGIAGILRYKI